MIICKSFLLFPVYTNSGAPKIKVPIFPSKVTADNFRLDEKGKTILFLYSTLIPNRFCKAIEVWLLSSWAFKKEPIIWSISNSFSFANVMTSFTFIVPSVIVPVLSKHKTSTRASISIQYNS